MLTATQSESNEDISTLCRRIVEASSDAVIFADRDGVIRLWNRGAELVFGYAAGDAIGRSLDMIIPERLRPAHWDAFHHSIETGRTKHVDRVLTTRATHKDGERRYVDLSFGLVKDADGAVLGAFAVGRDATKRYLDDAASRKLIAKLESTIAELRAKTPG